MSAQTPSIPPDFGPNFVHPTVGAMVRSRRAQRGFTLQRLAELVGCAKSYLSIIEHDRRAAPPGDKLLSRIETALEIYPGCLIQAARWQAMPGDVKREVSALQGRSTAGQRLAEILSAGSLDAAYRTGELKRLIDRITPGDESATSPARAAFPLEVPLINRVAAGYPREFTDLGYPARVADEYVRVPDLADPDAFAARVVGDSMAPAYLEGDIVVFSPAREIKSGTDCFVRIEPDHETTFKRAYFETDERGRELIRLQPLNSAHPPRVLPRDQVAGLYAAVSVTRAVG